MHVEDVASDDNGQDLRCGKHRDALNIRTSSMCKILRSEEKKDENAHCLLLEDMSETMTYYEAVIEKDGKQRRK